MKKQKLIWEIYPISKNEEFLDWQIILLSRLDFHGMHEEVTHTIYFGGVI